MGASSMWRGAFPIEHLVERLGASKGSCGAGRAAWVHRKVALRLALKLLKLDNHKKSQEPMKARGGKTGRRFTTLAIAPVGD